jgi:hypothetical protein
MNLLKRIDHRIFGPIQGMRYDFLRIPFGILSLLFFIDFIPDRFIWLGNEGLITPRFAYRWTQVVGGFNPLADLGSPSSVNLVLALGVISSVLMTIGLKSRLTTPITAFLVWGIQHRCFYVMDGGDQLLRVVLVF